MQKSEPKDSPITFRTFFGEAVVQQEMLLFVLVSAFDVFMTYIMLREGAQFFEANPVARYVINGWGVTGMVNFKFGAVAIVCILSQIIAQRRPLVARWMLLGSAALVACVVAYSLMLFVRHAGMVPDELTWMTPSEVTLTS